MFIYQLFRSFTLERKTSIFLETSFGVVEKYDWCDAKKGHPEPTIQLLFPSTLPKLFQIFFSIRQIVLNLFFYQTILKICICWPGSEKGEINRKNFSHFLPPWRLRRGSKESLSLPPCIKSPDVRLGRYTIMGLSSSHNDNFWKINTSSSHVSYGINYCVSEKCLRTKHCQQHNGPKTLSTLLIYHL